MGIGGSNWLQGKKPVKFCAYHIGGIFTPSGWYLEAQGIHQRFHLKNFELRRLLQEGKAYIIIDENVIEERIAKYRGKKTKEQQTAQQKGADPKVVQLDEVRRRREFEARKAADEAKRQQLEAEKKRRLAEAAKKALEKRRSP